MIGICRVKWLEPTLSEAFEEDLVEGLPDFAWDVVRGGHLDGARHFGFAVPYEDGDCVFLGFIVIHFGLLFVLLLGFVMNPLSPIGVFGGGKPQSYVNCCLKRKGFVVRYIVRNV